jgi:hypothetical protein
MIFNEKILPSTLHQLATIGSFVRSFVLSLALEPAMFDFSCRQNADCTGANSPFTVESQSSKLDSLLNVASASFDGSLMIVRLSNALQSLSC